LWRFSMEDRRFIIMENLDYSHPSKRSRLETQDASTSADIVIANFSKEIFRCCRHVPVAKLRIGIKL